MRSILLREQWEGSRGDVTSFALPIQKIVQELDPELAVADVLTMDQVIGKAKVDASFNAALLFAFAVLSLLLASVGLFGVLSYIVGQRTPEIGIRLALGAQRGELLRLTLVDWLKPAAGGLLLGLAGAMAAARMIRSLLYGVQPLDAGVFVVVAISLFAVAVFACLLPLGALRGSTQLPSCATSNAASSYRQKNT